MEDLRKHKEFLAEAIAISERNVLSGGGPFGAVVVKDGVVVGVGVNKVTLNNDPTAHAEVTAIREAAQKLNSFDLTDCVIYTSCEPCPMCLGAIYWARISKIYYGNTKADAAKIGFDDQFIYEELDRPFSDRHVKGEQLLREDAIRAFRMWDEKEDKEAY